MRQKMRKAVAGVAVCGALLCVAASNPFSKKIPSKTLRERVEILEQENARLQQAVLDLTAKLNVLTQRVNAQCGPGDAGIFERESTGLSVYPPEMPGLEVVRVQPESAAPSVAPSDSGGRLIIAKSDSYSPEVIEHSGPLPGTQYVPLPDPALTMSPGTTSPDRGRTYSPPPRGAADVATSSSATPASSSDLHALASYSEIKDLVERGKAEEARPKMESYLKRFPGGAHEAEVANWLGTVLFSQGDYGRAIEVLKVVTNKHYESAVAPEALYLLGESYLELGRTKEAGDAFREVKILYPFSNAAKMAEEKLSSCCP